jgi:hypothetical protein
MNRIDRMVFLFGLIERVTAPRASKLRELLLLSHILFILLILSRISSPCVRAEVTQFGQDEQAWQDDLSLRFD